MVTRGARLRGILSAREGKSEVRLGVNDTRSGHEMEADISSTCSC